MTLQPHPVGWEVVIEQGNGDVIKTIELTELERVQLGFMLQLGRGEVNHLEFVDVFRSTANCEERPSTA